MRKAARAIIIHNDQLLVMKRNKFGKQYYSLLGGGIESGETPEQALVREVREETTLDITNYRLVFTEEPGDPFGMQYIYLCDFPGGEPSLPPDSIEAKISAMGKNLYAIAWLPLKDLAQAPLVSETLKLAIVGALERGFPNQPMALSPSNYVGDKNGA